MLKTERLQLVALLEQRISDLENELSGSRSLSEKMQDQEGDASANLDLSIAAVVDEKILAGHRVQLAQLKNNLLWMQTDNAGLCSQCSNEIPVARIKTVLGTRLCVVCAGRAND